MERDIMSTINVKHNLIFIRVPKTASLSIGNVSFVGNGTHLSARKIKNIMRMYLRGCPTYGEMFKYGFVRNPWDRIVSGYFYASEKDKLGTSDKKGFNDFVESINEDYLYKIFFLEEQWKYLCNRRKKVIVNFVGKYENLEQDWGKVCKKLKMYEELEVLNKSDHKPYQEYYTAKSKKKVTRMYKDDIEMFNYKYG